MKLALLGGGGFRTPSIYRVIADGRTATRYDDVALYDVDSARLERVEAVLAGIDRSAASPVRRRRTTRLEEAVEGADVVYCAVRVGGLEGRLLDETIAIENGAVGHETAGAGGIAFALRTVPAVARLARATERHAPRALFINATNPVGLVTEAVQQILGDRAVGICDSPPDLCKRVARALRRRPEDLWFDYFGINHLGWLRAVFHRGRDLLPELLADDDRIASFEEGRLFGANWLRSVGMVPVKPLFYYYRQREALAAMRAGRVRAAYLRETQGKFFGAATETPSAALSSWERVTAEREAHYMDEAWSTRPADQRRDHGLAPGGYGGMALGLVDALRSDVPRVSILNVRNRSSLPFLDPDAVVEVPCVVGRGGIVPVAVGDVPLAARSLVVRVRAAERLAIAAANRGSRRLALSALAAHPLVGSVEIARRILDQHIERQPGLRTALA